MRPALLLAATLLAAAPLKAQFWSELANPKVEMSLPHPPDLGIRAAKIALAPGRDADSRELIGELMTDLIRGGQIEVVDRGRMDQVLRNLGLDDRNWFDPSSLEALNRDLGPAVFVVLEVHRAAVSHSAGSKESKDSKGVVTITRTAKATLDFIATLQAADLGQGRVHGVERLEDTPSRENSSTSGTPAHPKDAELRRLAFDHAKARIHRLLLPWHEDVKLTFFDDDNYKMDQAARAAAERDFKRTLALARDGEAEARADVKGNPKYRQRVFYNLGVAHLLVGDLEQALPCFQEARDLNPEASIFRDGLKECQRALALRAAYRTWEQQVPKVAARERAPGAGRRAVEERLEELDRLNRKGLLTRREYEERRAAILKEL